MADVLYRIRSALADGRRLNDAVATEAADEIERLRSLTTWQPIETAPMDGTAIALLFRHDLRKGDYDKDGALWMVRAEKGEAWWMENANKPIAWLPLPTPPGSDT